MMLSNKMVYSDVKSYSLAIKITRSGVLCIFHISGLIPQLQSLNLICTYM